MLLHLLERCCLGLEQPPKAQTRDLQALLVQVHIHPRFRLENALRRGYQFKLSSSASVWPLQASGEHTTVVLDFI